MKVNQTFCDWEKIKRKTEVEMERCIEEGHGDEGSQRAGRKRQRKVEEEDPSTLTPGCKR